MTTSQNLKGATVRRIADKRRKWIVLADEGQYLVIVNGKNFDSLRKRVLRTSVIVEPTANESESYVLGSTIHDEVVTLTRAPQGIDRWYLLLDGARFGRADSFEGKLVAASRLIPEHRRTGALTLLPFTVQS